MVDIFARRLQVQESLTAQIGDDHPAESRPAGRRRDDRAPTHQCMTLRAVNQPEAIMETTHFTGVFDTDAELAPALPRCRAPATPALNEPILT